MYAIRSYYDVTPHTHPYVNELVARGDLGMKTGKGFRTWTPEQAQAGPFEMRGRAGQRNNFV